LLALWEFEWATCTIFLHRPRARGRTGHAWPVAIMGIASTNLHYDSSPGPGAGNLAFDPELGMERLASDQPDPMEKDHV